MMRSNTRKYVTACVSLLIVSFLLALSTSADQLETQHASKVDDAQIRGAQVENTNVGQDADHGSMGREKSIGGGGGGTVDCRKPTVSCPAGCTKRPIWLSALDQFDDGKAGLNGGLVKGDPGQLSCGTKPCNIFFTCSCGGKRLKPTLCQN